MALLPTCPLSTTLPIVLTFRDVTALSVLLAANQQPQLASIYFIRTQANRSAVVGEKYLQQH